MTILGGAINYLLLRARTVTLFNGIPITEDEGWERLLSTVHRLIRGVEDVVTSKEPNAALSQKEDPT